MRGQGLLSSREFQIRAPGESQMRDRKSTANKQVDRAFEAAVGRRKEGGALTLPRSYGIRPYLCTL